MNWLQKRTEEIPVAQQRLGYENEIDYFTVAWQFSEIRNNNRDCALITESIYTISIEASINMHVYLSMQDSKIISYIYIFFKEHFS